MSFVKRNFHNHLVLECLFSSPNEMTVDQLYNKLEP